MDAIIGRYKVCMEESGLVLRHPTGLIFDFEPNEVLGLWNFIDFYRVSFTEKQFDTDSQHKAIDTVDTEELIDYTQRWIDKQS